MNKKLILLMLALPLILMLSLFTATSTVSLVISVPVSKIVVNEEDVVYMDLEETYEISYTVYPTNAANQKVYYSVEPYGESAQATVKIEDGKITAESCGKVKITVTTVDGGFKDSFILEISTNTLQSISASVEEEVIKIGESVEIQTSYTPPSAQYQTQLKYEIVEGVGVVSVSPQGKITGENVGNAKIKVYCTLNGDVYDEVEVCVENSYPMEFLKKSDTLTTMQSTGEMGLFVDEMQPFTYTYEILNEDGTEYTALTHTLDKENKTFAYEFQNQDACVLKIRLTVTTAEGSFVDECTITRVGKIQASWVEPFATAISLQESKEIYFNVVPSNAEIGYELSLSKNGKYVDCTVKDGYLLVKATEGAAENIDANEGFASEEITLTLWLTSQPNEKVTLTKTVNVY